MTEELFRGDAYLVEAEASVLSAGPEGIVLDRTLFYPAGGGQPGDTGRLLLGSGVELLIADTRKGEGGILHIPAEGAGLPAAGQRVGLALDWARRHRLMRMHTALHLLCSLVEGAVTGGQIGAERSRLDFDIPSGTVDKDGLTERLNALVAADHPVADSWITDEELAANPGLVRTMSVKPPTGTGRVRTVRIGRPEAVVDYQPCGGTHVRATGEIGGLAVVKVENKGRQNRRIQIALTDG